MYPTYKIDDKEQAVRHYWDEYYSQAMEYEEIYPESFRIFETEDVLNNESSQLELFDFLGFDGEVSLNIKENVLLSV